MNRDELLAFEGGTGASDAASGADQEGAARQVVRDALGVLVAAIAHLVGAGAWRFGGRTVVIRLASSSDPRSNRYGVHIEHKAYKTTESSITGQFASLGDQGTPAIR